MRSSNIILFYEGRSHEDEGPWALKSHNSGLPWWHSGWESACQCRGHGFEPWSGKIPHATERLGPWATVAEPARLEPVLRSRRGGDSGRPAHRDEEWPPLAATRESPPTETKTQHSQKKKKKKKKKVIIQSCRFWNAQELAAWAAFWQRLEGPSQQSIPWGYVGDIVRQLWKSTNLFLEKALSVQICRANSLPGELNRWSVRGHLVVRAWGFSMGDEGGHVPAFFKQLKLAS